MREKSEKQLLITTEKSEKSKMKKKKKMVVTDAYVPCISLYTNTHTQLRSLHEAMANFM